MNGKAESRSRRANRCQCVQPCTRTHVRRRVCVQVPKWRAALRLTWWHCAVLGLATQSRCYVIGRDGVNNIAARAIDTDEFSTRIHHVVCKVVKLGVSGGKFGSKLWVLLKDFFE